MESSCNITSCKWCFSHSWHTTQSTYLCSMDLSSSQFLLWAWASYAMHFRLSKAFSLSWWMHLRDWSMLFHTVDGAYQTSLFIIWSSQPLESRRWKSKNLDIVVCLPLHTTILINNLDFSFKTKQPTVENQGSFVSITTGTFIPLTHGAMKADFEYSSELWDKSSLNPVGMEDTKLELMPSFHYIHEHCRW